MVVGMSVDLRFQPSSSMDTKPKRHQFRFVGRPGTVAVASRDRDWVKLVVNPMGTVSGTLVL